MTTLNTPENISKLTKFIYKINQFWGKYLFTILTLLLIDKFVHISILNNIIMILIALLLLGRLAYVYHPALKDLPKPPDIVVDYDGKDDTTT
jgi:hypothetical protein